MADRTVYEIHYITEDGVVVSDNDYADLERIGMTRGYIRESDYIKRQGDALFEWWKTHPLTTGCT